MCVSHLMLSASWNVLQLKNTHSIAAGKADCSCQATATTKTMRIIHMSGKKTHPNLKGTILAFTYVNLLKNL